MRPWVPGSPACSGPRLAEGSLVTGTILGATDNRERETKACRPRKRFCYRGQRSAGADAAGKDAEGESWRGAVQGRTGPRRGVRGPSGAAKSPRAAPPPAPPGPLCPPATRRARPGRLGSSLGLAPCPLTAGRRGQAARSPRPLPCPGHVCELIDTW